MRIVWMAVVGALATTPLMASERPRGPFVGVLLGVGSSGCPIPPDQFRCLVEDELFRAEGPSLGLELGLALDRGLAVALELEGVWDYDELGSQSRIGPTLRYAPLPWIWVGAGPVVGTATGTLGGSASSLGVQIGGGLDARWRRLGFGVRAQHAWLGEGLSQLTVDAGLRWYFRRQ